MYLYFIILIFYLLLYYFILYIFSTMKLPAAAHKSMLVCLLTMYMTTISDSSSRSSRNMKCILLAWQ